MHISKTSFTLLTMLPSQTKHFFRVSSCDESFTNILCFPVLFFRLYGFSTVFQLKKMT